MGREFDEDYMVKEYIEENRDPKKDIVDHDDDHT